MSFISCKYEKINTLQYQNLSAYVHYLLMCLCIHIRLLTLLLERNFCHCQYCVCVCVCVSVKYVSLHRHSPLTIVWVQTHWAITFSVYVCIY